MSQTSFSLEIFIPKDAVFHGLSSDAISLVKTLRLCLRKIKIHEKFKSFFAKNHLVDPQFLHELTFIRGS